MPSGVSPAAKASAGEQPNTEESKFARQFDGRQLSTRASSPHGYARFSVPAAANSHSASVGNLRLAHLQYASASYQLTCIRVTSGARATVWSKDLVSHRPPSRTQYTGC